MRAGHTEGTAPAPMPAPEPVPGQALRDYRAIWRAAAQRDPRTVTVMRWLVPVLLAGLAIGVAFAARHARPGAAPPALLAVRGLLAIGAFWVAVLWTMLFVPASVLLNAAASARLVPRQRRRLLQMATAGWLLATAGFVAASGTWTAVPLVGLYLLGFGMMRAGETRAVLLIVLPANWPLVSRMLPPAWVGALASPYGAIASGLLLLALGAWALRRLYPDGDARLDRRADQVRRIELTRFSSAAWTSDALADRRAGAIVLRLYAAALRRDCRLGYRRADPGRMLMWGLGPVVHWSAWAPGMALLLALGVAVRAVATWFGRTPIDAAPQWVVGVGLGTLATLVVFGTVQYTQQLRKYRGEQGLLRLTPLAGGADLLNRRLATQLLRRALGNWAMQSAAILVLGLLVGADSATLLRALALCCLAGQVALYGLLGDYAEGFGWNAALALRAAALAALQALAAVGLGQLSGTTPWAWLVVLACGVAGARVKRDWGRMLAAAPAFPTGRLA